MAVDLGVVMAGTMFDSERESLLSPAQGSSAVA